MRIGHQLLTLSLAAFFFNFSSATGIIKLQNGNIHTSENAAQFITDAASFELPVHEGKYHLLLQFQDIPLQSERGLIEETGLELIEYLPENTYIAQLPFDYDLSQLQNFNIRFIGPVPKALTMHPDLYQEVYPAHAMVGTHRIRLQILPYRNFEPEGVKDALLDYGVDVFKDPHYPGKISVEADLQDIEALATAPFTFYLAPIDVEPYLENYTSRTSHRSNAVDNYLPGGDRYDGTGINVGLQDDGFIGPHIDYQGRLVQFTATDGGNHGDHVGGTIMGAGNLNPRNKGMAPGVTIKVGYFFQINNSMTNYYNNDSIYITSASLGATCNGGYDGNAVTRDQQINSLPHLMHVFSAGNSQSSNCGYGAGSGWGTITGGHKQAKNLIAVGALDDNDGMSGYSSWGPAADGRLKPEVSARGSAVISTGAGNSYYTASGTSMACPGTSGALAQLYHAYRDLNSQAFPPSELLKAIMMNCAEDLGNPGPDYKFGYGRVNNRRSLEVLKNNWHTSNTISQGGSNTFNITVPANSSQLRVMVYWHDYEGTPGASQALVNNLDMTVTDPSSLVFQPWILDPTPNSTNLDANATRGLDNLNNHEQVTISSPAAGTYTVTVSGTAVPQGPQDYVLVYYVRPDTIALTYPLGGEPFEVNTTEKLRWDALGTSGNFTLEYSTDNGASWNNISSTIPGTRRYYDWNVPNVVTAQAKIRISRSGLVTESDSFSIIDIPTNLSMSDKCAGIGTLTWNAVPGADAYDVFALGNKYMDSIGTTTATFFDVPGLSIGNTNWYSVRARTNAGAVGMRANAIEYTHNGAGVCFPIDLSATNLVSPAAGCGLTSSETVAIEVRNQGSDTIFSGTAISIWYQLNGGAVVSETANLTSNLISGSATTLTFSAPGDFSAQANSISFWVNIAGDPYQLNDTVSNFGLVNLPLVNSYPYLEDFEADTGGWYSVGGLWEWGSPNGPSINTNAPNGVNSWMTDLDANYPDNALAFVQSPCFDFSALTNPWIRLDINVASEFSWDGAILQASTNSGTTWSTVGAFGDPGNWYNDNTVFALSGLDPSEEGWTGSSGGWISASNALTGLGGASNVWLRIAFASDGAVVADGIAFDNVEIFEPLSDDVSISAISEPSSSACLTATEAVNLSIFNQGSLTQSSIPVAVQVTGPINSGLLRDTLNSNLTSGNQVNFNFGSTVDLSATGSYTIRAWTELNNDQDVSNDTFEVVVNSIAPISSFPWTEDFEGFSLCGNSNNCNLNCSGAVNNNWIQDNGDQQDWRVDEGATASANTGPDQDYDPGTTNGKYIYTEASGGCDLQTMNIISPCFDLNVLSNPRVSFFYHMYGATTGTLHLDISTDNGANWTNLWSLSGQQQGSSGAAWLSDTVDISGYSGTVRIRFRGVTGNDFTSDMAIDAVTVFDVVGADVGVSAVNSPSSGTCLSNAEAIDLTLQNFGILSQSNIPVTVSVSGPINSLVRDTLTASVSGGSNAAFTFGPTVDMSAAGTYTITAWTSLNGDANLINDTTIATVSNGSGISSFPWTEDFESFNICGNSNTCGLICAAAVANGWYQDDNDQQDWRVDEGTTTSPNTGPTQDHDPGTANGNYIYTEASNGCNIQTMNIVSPCFNLDSLADGRFSFFYHMYGVNSGTINVDISLDNGVNWTNLRTISGQQQSNDTDPWIGDTIDISSYSGLARFRFNGITGNGFESDMAIDAVQVFSNPTLTEDVGVSAITSPTSGLCGNASATVTITVNNFGATPVSNIPVEFEVSGPVNTSMVSETVAGPIAPGGNATFSFTLPANLSAQGTYTVSSWTALSTDINVLNDTSNATVTIQDNVNPSISCSSGNISAANGAGQCSAIVNFSTPTFSDNCTGATMQQTAGLASGSSFPVGVTTNTFVVTDVAGNTASCSFTVTVSDTEDPVISCPGNIITGNNAGTCGALITYATPSFSDNCLGGSITQIAGLASGSTFPIGVTTNTFVATDAAGNTDTCSFTVTINDTEDPVVSCPGNITAGNNPGTCGALVTYPAPTFSDNCPGGSISQIAGLASGSTFPIGITTNTFVATDGNGNADTCSFTVTVTDSENPVVNCSSNIVVNAAPGACNDVVNYATVTASDNCPGVTLTQIAGLSSGSTFPLGVTTNTFRATDVAGNISNCSFTVTVVPADTVVAAFTYASTALTVNFTNQSRDANSYAWDFGDGNNSAATNPSHTYSSPGTYPVQLIAFGACENDTVVINVTVSATSNNWIGVIDSSWSNPGNWSLGTVPNGGCLEIDIMIPAGAPNMPVVDANIAVNNITVMAGAQLMIAASDTLASCGNITHSGIQNMGSGTLWINGSSAQLLSGQLVVETFVMDNPAGLNIQAGSSLALRYALIMVQGDIDVPATSSLTLRSRPSKTAYLDDFTFPSAGSITDGAGDGNITMERWVINPVNAFHFISSAVVDGDVNDWANDFTITGPNFAQVIPLPNCDPNNLAPNSPYGQLFEHREWRVTNCSFEGWFVRSADSLGHGQGFAGIIPNNTLIDVTGIPGTGPVSFGPATRSTTNNTSYKGWVMVGNPYPSAISWPAMSALNPALGATAYLWQSSGYYGGTLQPLSALLPGDNIASSQAFQVEVLGPAPQSTTVQFANSIRTAGDPSFQRTAGNYEQRVDLVVEGNGFADKTHVLFLNGPTNGWDGNYDGRKQPSVAGQPTLFSYIGNDIMSINARPSFNSNGASVPVGFMPGDSSTFEIRLDVDEGFPFGTLILLEDKQEGIMHNLLDQATYSFSSDTSDLHDRFVLHFTPPVDFNLTEESCTGDDGVIGIDMGNFGQGSWQFTWDSVVVTGTGSSSSVIQANQVQNFSNLQQGNYQVSFHLGGYSLDTVLNLTGKQRVAAGFSVSKLVLQVGEMFNLNDLSTGATNRQWSLGDGTIISNQSTATHSYSLDGSYTIRQDVNNNDCAADTSIEVQVLKNATGIFVIDDIKFHVTSEPGFLILNVHGSLSDHVTVNVYDVRGAHVMNSEIESSTRIPWDYAQGYYIVRLDYKSQSHSQQVLFR